MQNIQPETDRPCLGRCLFSSEYLGTAIVAIVVLALVLAAVIGVAITWILYWLATHLPPEIWTY